MINLGEPKDMNQEGLFDNVESLDLNWFQAQALYMAISTQLEESKRALAFFEELTPEQIEKHETLTVELISDETDIHSQLIIQLDQVVENLKETLVMLEPNDGIVKPKT